MVAKVHEQEIESGVGEREGKGEEQEVEEEEEEEEEEEGSFNIKEYRRPQKLEREEHCTRGETFHVKPEGNKLIINKLAAISKGNKIGVVNLTILIQLKNKGDWSNCKRMCWCIQLILRKLDFQLFFQPGNASVHVDEFACDLQLLMLISFYSEF